ncbi:unnamed protein product [Fusarium graminearum]|uniref:Chromosome 1, complete genome n=1 Tax=Gibberella zeae (strain ATCC MYA-4620 / CBS 123657 / FGSC 9075 / NRRL 31084 / PH-1) TaxID=229533 RepID=A0A0E0RVE1_GIBZE|nr:hypothetical protein FG05_35079 [Fusarium graminearum]CEF75216.1 unnamed protein product [Fusarium graminearum]
MQHCGSSLQHHMVLSMRFTSDQKHMAWNLIDTGHA